MKTSRAILLAGALTLLAWGCDSDPHSSGLGGDLDPLPCADYSSRYTGWQSVPLPEKVRAMALTESFAVLVDRDSLLSSYSLPTTEAPTLRGSAKLDCVSWDVDARSDVVVAACAADGVRLSPLGSDGSLGPVASWQDGMAARETALEGELLAVIGDGRLRILSLDEALRIVPLSDIAIPNEAGKLEMDGSVLTLQIAPGAGLQIYSIEDPANPLLADELVTSDLWDYAIGGGHLVFAINGSGCNGSVRVRDISDPFAITSLPLHSMCTDTVRHVIYDSGHFFLEYEGSDHSVREFRAQDIGAWEALSVTPIDRWRATMGVRNGWIYAATGDGDYLSDPSFDWAGVDQPVGSPLLDFWSHSPGMDWIGFRQEILFGVGVNWGLEALDFSEPRNLRELGKVRADPSSRGLHVGPRYVFFGNTSKLVTVDAQDPAAMIWEQEVDVGSLIYGIGEHQGYLYLDLESEGIEIVDIALPLAPEPVAHVDPILPASSMRHFGEFLVLLGRDAAAASAVIYDSSDPLGVWPYKALGSVGDLWADAVYDFTKQRLVLVSEQVGVVVYDLTDLLDPIFLGQFPKLGKPSSCALHEDMLYVTVEDQGLVVLDLRDPANIARIGHHGGPSVAKLATNGELLFSAAWNHGLESLRLACSSP